jgi:hypothetical protein
MFVVKPFVYIFRKLPLYNGAAFTGVAEVASKSTHSI